MTSIDLHSSWTDSHSKHRNRPLWVGNVLRAPSLDSHSHSYYLSLQRQEYLYVKQVVSHGLSDLSTLNLGLYRVFMNSLRKLKHIVPQIKWSTKAHVNMELWRFAFRQSVCVFYKKIIVTLFKIKNYSLLYRFTIQNIFKAKFYKNSTLKQHFIK